MKTGWNRLESRMMDIGKTQEEVDVMTRAQMIELHVEILFTGQALMEPEEKEVTYHWNC
jgi:hypothetical protein